MRHSVEGFHDVEISDINTIPTGDHARIIHRSEGVGGVQNRYALSVTPLEEGNGTIEFFISGIGWVSTDTPLNLNQWYHISALYDGEEMKIYIDGLLTSTMPASGTFEVNEWPFWIASANNSSFFDGIIDNVRIWNYALSNFQVQEYITCLPSGTEEGLVGYWNFDQGSDTTAYDQTGNGNDGVVNGATWSSETPEQSCSFCSSSDNITVTINVCGCTDSEAVNYNVEANQDDSSCCYDIEYVNDTYDEGYSDGVDSVICPENNCPADLTLDGIVSTADLLMFLVSFGTICE